MPSTTAVVNSPDRRWREMIESSLRAGGFEVREPQVATRPQAVIFDADPWDEARAGALCAIRAEDEQARIIAAVGFPRLDLEGALRQSGADEVWFKLAALQELAAKLRGGRHNMADRDSGLQVSP